ncbi:MAG: aminotransferase class III-fold pyridoxal phosphate-dependent enzyme, partial [Candidatus Bathyarchaeia archaeon]
GHGALLLGHLHPVITKAVLEQAQKGTHYGASQELEIEWAEKIIRLIPSAKNGLVEFTSSGTEGTLMALRMARAYTGRKKIIKFAGHFHGWHDYLVVGYSPPFDKSSRAGIPEETAQNTIIVPPNNIEAVERVIEGGDVAGVILEPGGGAMGLIPSDKGFLKKLRNVTRENGVALIFDEVVTGFRDAPGGTQELCGVVPDITVLGKIVAGGYPGGAVTGKGEYFKLLEFGDAEWNSLKKIPHPGTYNANPQCAAAGNACLGVILNEREKIYPHLNSLGEMLKKGFQDVLQDLRLRGVAQGETSIITLTLGSTQEDFKISTFEAAARIKELQGHPAHGLLGKAMINRGIHLMSSTSCRRGLSFPPPTPRRICRKPLMPSMNPYRK